ncbi:MAG: PAS domain S-box protein [Bacteroidota bacterium]
MSVNTLNIIHVDQSAEFSEYVEQELKNADLDFHLIRVEKKVEFEVELQFHKIDLVICDHFLNGLTSYDVIQMLANHGSKIPLIVLSHNKALDFAVTLMKEGADDYLLKDQLQKLPHAIKLAINKNQQLKKHELKKKLIFNQSDFFNKLFESSFDGMVLIDELYNIKFFTPAFTRIFEDLEEFGDAQHFTSYINAEDVELVKLKIEEVSAKANATNQFMFRSLSKTQEPILIECIAKNMNNVPEISSIVLYFREATEIVKQNVQLQLHNAKFQSLLENLSEAIVLSDAAGKIQFQSQSTFKIIGFTSADLLNTEFFDLIHPDSLDEAKSLMQKALRNPGMQFTDQLQIRREIGDYIWIETHFRSRLDDKNIDCVIINFKDITHYKELTERLSKSEAVLNHVLRSIKVGYIILDKSFKIVSFNESSSIGFMDVFGKQLVEGGKMFDYIPADRRIPATDIYRRVLKGETVNYELNFGPTDNRIFIDVTVFPMIEDDNKINGLIIAMKDISERKSIEMERESMTVELVQRNKNLDQFEYIVSHDLRAPVANILGLCNILNMPQLTRIEDQTTAINGIHKAAGKLDEVIMDLNKILQKRSEIVDLKEEVNLNNLVEEIKHLFLGSQHRKPFEIITAFENGEYFLYTVKIYLTSIFYNLISNSIKYKKPEYDLIAHVSGKIINDEYVLKFKDNGIGIDLNAHGDKLFGLYKRFHPHIDGKGMGLYLVKNQVELLGGRISVESAVNLGTTFIINLPLKQQGEKSPN